jgi:diacylglycerol kinase family enzyme
MKKKWLLVANPTARSGKGAKRIEKAIRALKEFDFNAEFVATEPHGQTIATVSNKLLSEDIEGVIAMGGDGTFREVGSALMKTSKSQEVLMAHLPAGTANDQAKSFGIPRGPLTLKKNIEMISERHFIDIDVGRIEAQDHAGETKEEAYFFDSAGWGVSPHILSIRNDDKKLVESIPFLKQLYKHNLVYAGAVLRTFIKTQFEPHSFEVEIEVDGQEYKWPKLVDLVVKATKVYAGLWVLDPRSEPDDGLFEVVPFTSKRDWSSKAIVHLDRTGLLNKSLAEIGIKHSEGFQGKKIKLNFITPFDSGLIAAQIDGEEFPMTDRAEITVLERALRLVVPEKYTVNYLEREDEVLESFMIEPMDHRV